jgi:predicted enzyme related to lactoylglutathione lyase
MSRVVHFELYAEDPQRAIKFYQDLLGWKIDAWNGPQEYWLVTTGPSDQPGINGGIMRRRGNVHCVNTVQVEDLDSFLDRVPQHGGQVVVPKMPIPGVGWLGYFTDPEGNLIGAMQPDAAAH